MNTPTGSMVGQREPGRGDHGRVRVGQAGIAHALDARKGQCGPGLVLDVHPTRRTPGPQKLTTVTVPRSEPRSYGAPPSSCPRTSGAAWRRSTANTPVAAYDLG